MLPKFDCNFFPVRTALGMQWFYASNGQQAGPISEAELEALLRAGTINPQTLIWREGMTDWQPLGVARPVGGPPPIPGGVKCAECGREFPVSEVIQLNHSWVCSGCKPIFLQRLQEGAQPSGAAGGIWREDRLLVTRSETPFPDRCVRCNEPADGYRLRRRLYWHPPAFYLLILVSIWIYIIVALCIRKKAALDIGLCPRHRNMRKWSFILGWGGFVGGVGLIIYGATAGYGWVIFGGVLLILAGIICGVILGARVSAAKITPNNVWLRGVNRDFLAGLPDWPGV
jgi:hypothetical protein